MYRCKLLQVLGYRGVFSALLLCILLGIWEVPAKAMPYVTADSAVVIDAETGAVLGGKNMHVRRPPASTTKIMTTLLAIEKGHLKDKVKVSHRAAIQEGSSIWLKEGEVLTMEELLYGMMLNSGNDACVAVAEHISGSVEKFAELMTRRAKEIGALHTTFKNPNGLPNDQHLTTAYDLAVIMRYAMQYPVFRQVTATKAKTISWPGNKWGRALRNHNQLLWDYPGCDGGKTGYTRAAGRCLVSTATRNGRRVIAVVMHSDNLWQDSSALLDYGLNNYKNVTLIGAGKEVYTLPLPKSKEKALKLVTARNFVITVPKNSQAKTTTKIILRDNLRLPILAGQKVGVMEVMINGEKVGQVDLVAKNTVTEHSMIDRFWRWFSSIIKTFA